MPSSLPDEAKAGLAQLCASLAWALLVLVATGDLLLAALTAVAVFSTLVALSWVLEGVGGLDDGSDAGAGVPDDNEHAFEAQLERAEDIHWRNLERDPDVE